ncbi:MAG: macrocin-O-methyltransferase [Phycisphaeraceae bacterium]|nr:macrocin-O-methyltransferase [Phycisphaeraceae bacterium]
MTQTRTPPAADFDGRKRYGVDQQVEQKLTDLFAQHEIDPLEAINHFPLFARRVHLKKFLAHWELFRQTIELPGDIVELGVFRGLSLLTFANFLEVASIGDRTKRVFGFDNFTGFGDLTPEDGPDYDQSHKREGGFSPAAYQQQLREIIGIFDLDRFVPWKDRIDLVVGDIEQTVPQFVRDHPGLRISLLHFDCDMYRPTRAGLECLFPLVVRGGLVIFDEYGILEWSGESKAVDEYLADTDYVLKKFPWQGAPGAYLVKQ